MGRAAAVAVRPVLAHQAKRTVESVAVQTDARGAKRVKAGCTITRAKPQAIAFESAFHRER